ncbi:hypothetical protein [Corynebacterium macclintockiae]|uniref:hypothetical protein n=1 Tax=Corynebacterium macclintockiae TaxID=2913501 RepID=UPI003F69EF28
MAVQTVTDRLTAGTFFVLLQQALRPRTKARATWAGESDGLSNPRVLQGLIQIVLPDFSQPAAGKSFVQQTSELRNCRIDGDTAYMPVGGEEFAQQFTELIERDLLTALERTRSFVDLFLDVDNKGQRLAQMLGTVVARDTVIPSDLELVPLPGGQSLTKCELLNAGEVCLDALVLGLWKYVACNAPRNTGGRATFERWHHAPASQNAQWRFDPHAFGADESWTPTIIRYTPEDEEFLAAAGRDERIVEAEIVNEDDTREHDEHAADPAAETSAHVAPQVVFNQYGANSQQFASVGTLYIGGRGT